MGSQSRSPSGPSGGAKAARAARIGCRETIAAGSRSRPTKVEDAVERVLDDRVRQGLPRTITDPAVLARVASILRAARGGSAA